MALSLLFEKFHPTGFYPMPSTLARIFLFLNQVTKATLQTAILLQYFLNYLKYLRLWFSVLFIHLLTNFLLTSNMDLAGLLNDYMQSCFRFLHHDSFHMHSQVDVICTVFTKAFKRADQS